MATNTTLTSATVNPSTARETSVSTTYQRFNFPEGGANEVVIVSSAALYVAWPDSGKDDGGTVEAADNAEPVPANAGPTYPLSERTSIRAGYVLVAAPSGTADVTLIAQRRDT
ncbi:MAG: hypothetical protein H6739_20915 [Alphaproteobacteria bacterium]|nr:hypothetical protein [Alphaproteobacteria bacterium]